MNSITALYVSISMALHSAVDRLQEEEGQTSVEWIGISAVIVAVIGIFIGFKDQIGELMNTLFQRLLGEASTGSGITG